MYGKNLFFLLFSTEITWKNIKRMLYVMRQSAFKCMHAFECYRRVHCGWQKAGEGAGNLIKNNLFSS